MRKKPVVFYGTSILQGGCASRPGMAHTNILERWLNRECINLGFSGNALLDLEIAYVMAGVDASVFVLDFVPNAGVEQIKERAGEFYSIIRSKHPDTPVLFVEDPIFTHSRFTGWNLHNPSAAHCADKHLAFDNIFQIHQCHIAEFTAFLNPQLHDFHTAFCKCFPLQEARIAKPPSTMRASQ